HTQKRFRYSGKERDEESGLYYYGARYYAPWVGRWVSSDPLGTVDGVNPFRPFRNNPICFIDSYGFAGKKKKSPEEQDKDVEESFEKRVKAKKGEDLGGRPDRLFPTNLSIDLSGVAGEVFLKHVLDKDYELASKIFDHYLTGYGAPLRYTPPK